MFVFMYDLTRAIRAAVAMTNRKTFPPLVSQTNREIVNATLPFRGFNRRVLHDRAPLNFSRILAVISVLNDSQELKKRLLTCRVIKREWRSIDLIGNVSISTFVAEETHCRYVMISVLIRLC